MIVNIRTISIIMILSLCNGAHVISAVEPGEPIRVSIGCWAPEFITQHLLWSKITQRVPLALSGPNPIGDSPCCAVSCYDMDGDGDVDLSDFGEFSNWLSMDDPSSIVRWE